jgi:hypothetical protein
MSGGNLDARAWRRIAETKIEQAIEDGEFDNLPGFGQPLNFDDADSHDENWWLKRKAKLEGLSLLPPALELQRQVENVLKHIFTLKDEEYVRTSLAKLNAYIENANRRIGWGPPSRTMPLDIEWLVDQWQKRK